MASPIDFDNVLNFRDVGKTVNEYLGRRVIREGVIFRSARLDDATLDDRALIRDGLGIKAVIDLRTKTEHLTQARKREAQSTTPALLKSNAALVEHPHIDGIEYHEIKITGRPFEIFLLRQLSWCSLFRFLYLFIFGYRMEAISILGTEVMLPRGLVGMGLDTLDQSTVEIRRTLSLFADSRSLPSIVHCTQGKDRTGLVVTLVLMILGVPLSAIEHDYSLTDAALTPEREERLPEIHAIGLTDDWADTAKDMIVRVDQHLNDQYGGLYNYLDQIGFDKDDRAKVRENLFY